MSEHKATITWKRATESFSYEAYNRDHLWIFDGGIQLAASASPAYQGNPLNVDPEEAFVAALSSCHMLTFLALASRKRFIVDSYNDDAVGFLEKNDQGKLAITRAILRPKISFSGPTVPTAEQLTDLHHRSHQECFIANSVKTDIAVE